jgi:hypothetical protein
MPVKEIQREPLVTDDVRPYVGSWIAVREGKIIGSALDPIELRDNPAVRDDDALMPVPPDGEATLIL